MNWKDEIKVEAYPPQPKHGMLTGKMSTGIKITHIPTGLTVIKTSFRAPHANKAAALNIMEMLLTTGGSAPATRRTKCHKATQKSKPTTASE